MEGRYLLPFHSVDLLWNWASEAIKTGQTDKSSLSADIKKYSEQRDALDTTIADLQDKIEKAEKATGRLSKRFF